MRLSTNVMPRNGKFSPAPPERPNLELLQSGHHNRSRTEFATFVQGALKGCLPVPPPSPAVLLISIDSKYQGVNKRRIPLGDGICFKGQIFNPSGTGVTDNSNLGTRIIYGAEQPFDHRLDDVLIVRVVFAGNSHAQAHPL